MGLDTELDPETLAEAQEISQILTTSVFFGDPAAEPWETAKLIARLHRKVDALEDEVANLGVTIERATKAAQALAAAFEGTVQEAQGER